MKLCRTCNTEKSLDLFGNDKKSKDGKKNKCNSCHNDYMKSYYWKHREILAAKALAHHYKIQSVANEKRRLNRLKNLDKQMAHSRQWQKDNKEAAKAIKANWRHKNREVVKANKDKRNQLEKASNLPSKYIAELRRKPCNYCGNYYEGKMHIDHVIPISKGGLHTIENLVSSCATCNLSKSDKLLTKWLKTN
jgi:5-methylcytosine-specific restriction endonuclease McrA